MLQKKSRLCISTWKISFSDVSNFSAFSFGRACLFIFFPIFPHKSLNPWYLYSFQIIANRYSVFTDSWWVIGFSLSSRLHQEPWLTTLYSLHLAEKVCFCLSISSSFAYPPSSLPHGWQAVWTDLDFWCIYLGRKDNVQKISRLLSVFLLHSILEELLSVLDYLFCIELKVVITEGAAKSITTKYIIKQGRAHTKCNVLSALRGQRGHIISKYIKLAWVVYFSPTDHF